MEYKLSPSLIDSYNKYVLDDTLVTEESLIKSITGIRELSPAFLYGEAVHKFVEKGPEAFDYADGYYKVKVKGYDTVISFGLKSAEIVQAYRAERVGAINELPLTAFIILNETDSVRLNLRLDSLNLNVVEDIKTVKGREPNFMQYQDSMQWRIYLHATKAKLFKYQFFPFNVDSQNINNEVIYLEPPQEFVLRPYTDMLEDVKEQIRGLIDFCEKKDLLKHIVIE